MAFIAKITDTSATPVTAPLTTALYGTCDTAKSTVAKVVTCADFDKLIPGVTIRVKFDNENTASSPTLNVNSTGAKAIRAYGTTAANSNAIGSWVAGEIVEFMYLEISSTGYWYLTSSHAMFKTGSVNNITLGTATSASKITAPASGQVWSQITGWTTNTPTVVTLGTAIAVKSVKTNTSKTIKQWTFADVSCSLVTKSDVTVKSVKTGNPVMKTATISEGVLSFTTGDVVTEDKSASAVTITSKTASKATAADDISASLIVTEDKSIPNVTGVTAGTAASLTYSDATLTYTGVTVPVVSSTASATVVQLR